MRTKTNPLELSDPTDTLDLRELAELWEEVEIAMDSPKASYWDLHRAIWHYAAQLRLDRPMLVPDAQRRKLLEEDDG